MTISTEIAFNIVFERGLRLPANKSYEDPRVKEIAIELDRLRSLEIEQYKKLRSIFEESGIC
jgi:hypothetical protein